MLNYDSPDSSSLMPPPGEVAVHLTEPSRMGADGKNRDHVIDLIRQSRVRWLKNTEVCDILYNHRAYDFVLSPNAPVRPQGARGDRQIPFSSPACRDGPGSSRGGANSARGARGGARVRRASNAPRVSHDPHPNVSAILPARRARPRTPRCFPRPRRIPSPLLCWVSRRPPRAPPAPESR